MTSKKWSQLLLGCLISAICLWFAFRNIDITDVMNLITRVNASYIGLYVVALMLIQIFRALRWDRLIRSFAPVSPWISWRISNVGNMLIMILPLRLGEFARPYLLKQACGAKMSSGLGAAAVERVLDGLIVTLLFFMTTMLLPEQYQISPALWFGAQFVLAIFVGASFFLSFATLYRQQFMAGMKILERFISPVFIQKISSIVEAFVTGVGGLPNRYALLEVVAWTMVYWLCNALGLYWLICAFGWHLPILAGFVVVCVLVIGIMIPAGPGFLGTYQASLIAGLAIFNISRTDALAYSLIAYPLNLLVVLLCGLPYLLFQGKDNVVSALIDNEVAE